MKITEIIVKEMSFRRRKVFQIAFTQSLYARGVYVKVLTDEGVSGMGEAVPMPFVTGETIGGVIAAIEHMKPALLGAEVADIADLQQTLATRPDHEAVTNQVGEIMTELGVKPYILSTEACSICDVCTCPSGQPCRHRDKMHPCVESHGINMIPTLEENGIEFQFGGNVVTWVSLLFY